jgi:Flp pilus assembly protein TadG
MRLRLLDIARDRTGSVLVEFTLVLPVLLFLILGMLQFGIFYYDSILVARAAAAGARELSISRFDATAYADTIRAINTASSNLSGITITLSISNNGKSTACTSDTSNPTCQQSVIAAYGAVPPQPISVTVSYACNSNAIIPSYLINLAGICPLQSTMYAAVN